MECFKFGQPVSSLYSRCVPMLMVAAIQFHNRGVLQNICRTEQVKHAMKKNTAATS